MELSVNSSGPTTFVTVEASRIDAAVAIQFKDQMRAVTTPDTDRLVLDMGKVTFLDSSGLGAVVAVMKHLDPQTKLELAALTPTVAKVFRLTRLDTVFTIHPDLDAAGAGALRAS